MPSLRVGRILTGAAGTLTVAAALLAGYLLLHNWNEPGGRALGQEGRYESASLIHGIVYDGKMAHEYQPDETGRVGRPRPVAPGTEMSVVIQATGERLSGEQLGLPNAGLTGREGAMAVRIPVEAEGVDCAPRCRADSEVQFFVNGEDARTQPNRITLRRETQRVNVFAELPEPPPGTPEPGATLEPGATGEPGATPGAESTPGAPRHGNWVEEEFRPPQLITGTLWLNGEPAPPRTKLEAWWNDDSRYVAGRTYTGARGRFRLEVKRQIELQDPTEEELEKLREEEEPVPTKIPQGYRPATGSPSLPVNPRERCPAASKPVITFTAGPNRTALAEGTYWTAGEAVVMDLSDRGREPSAVFASLVYDGTIISAWRENPEGLGRRDDPGFEVWYNYTVSDPAGVSSEGGATSNMGPLYAGQCLLLNMREESIFQGIQLNPGWNAVAIK